MGVQKLLGAVPNASGGGCKSFLGGAHPPPPRKYVPVSRWGSCRRHEPISGSGCTLTQKILKIIWKHPHHPYTRNVKLQASVLFIVYFAFLRSRFFPSGSRQHKFPPCIVGVGIFLEYDSMFKPYMYFHNRVEYTKNYNKNIFIN